MPFDNLEPLPVEARILARAAEIVRSGWCQVYGAYERDDGGFDFCALGAIGFSQREIAPMDNMAAKALHHRLKVAIEQHLPTKYPNIISYNDAAGRTAEEVAQLLEKGVTDAIMGVTEYAI